MQVHLSVVGFGINDVPLTITPPNPTIKDVLDAFAEHSQTPFLYQSILSPFRKNVNLLFSFTYRARTLASILADSAGQEERVWQFYVSDADGKAIPNNYGQERQPYDQFKVSDGYSVKWRLVTVIKQPIEIAKRVRNATTPEQVDLRHNTVKLY